MKLRGEVGRLTSTNQVDDRAPDVAGSVGGEHNEHRHEEGCVPQVYAAYQEDPCPTDTAAGCQCGHAKQGPTPAGHSMQLTCEKSVAV